MQQNINEIFKNVFKQNAYEPTIIFIKKIKLLIYTECDKFKI